MTLVGRMRTNFLSRQWRDKSVIIRYKDLSEIQIGF